MDHMKDVKLCVLTKNATERNHSFTISLIMCVTDNDGLSVDSKEENVLPPVPVL